MSNCLLPRSMSSAPAPPTPAATCLTSVPAGGPEHSHPQSLGTPHSLPPRITGDGAFISHVSCRRLGPHLREEALTAPQPTTSGRRVCSGLSALQPHGGRCLVPGHLHWVGARLHGASSRPFLQGAHPVGEGGSRGPGQAVALWLVSGQHCGLPSVTFWPSFPLGDLAAFGRLVGGLSARPPWAAATLGLWNHGSWKRLFSSALSGKAHVRGLCD